MLSYNDPPPLPLHVDMEWNPHRGWKLHFRDEGDHVPVGELTWSGILIGDGNFLGFSESISR